jgi:hypothetical protein
VHELTWLGLGLLFLSFHYYDLFPQWRIQKDVKVRRGVVRALVMMMMMMMIMMMMMMMMTRTRRKRRRRMIMVIMTYDDDKDNDDDDHDDDDDDTLMLLPPGPRWQVEWPQAKACVWEVTTRAALGQIPVLVVLYPSFK